MERTKDLEALTKAFSGHGVDEKSLISMLGKWEPEERKAFRKGTPDFFTEDERQFEKWNDHQIRLIKHEFMRFKWCSGPCIHGKEAYGVLVEIGCTRSSLDLLGATRAYHSLSDHSVEEDVASHVNGPERKLLVALLSAYKYEGSKVNDDAVNSEAKTLSIAINNGHREPIIEDDEVIRIVSTRSKPHLQASTTKRFQDVEDLRLKETVQCLCIPQTYFSQVLDAALKLCVDKATKKALTRVVVSRADVDMKEIKQEYQKLYGVSLSQSIEDTANGNYNDFMITLIARES